MTAVCEALDVARSHIAAQRKMRPASRRGRPALDDSDLVAEIKANIASMPTYGYRWVHAVLRCNGRAQSVPGRTSSGSTG